MIDNATLSDDVLAQTCDWIEGAIRAAAAE